MCPSSLLEVEISADDGRFVLVIRPCSLSQMPFCVNNRSCLDILYLRQRGASWDQTLVVMPLQSVMWTLPLCDGETLVDVYARKAGSEPVQNPPAVVAEDVQAPVLEKAEQQKPRENVFKAASSREKRQSSMPLTKAEAASLEMGKVLPLKLVYKTGEGLYLSERILNSLNPEGVVVPYRINGKFFLLRIFDEVSAMSVQEAVAVAKKRERINGKPWMLLTPQQKESCKAVQTELNEVIKKIGGDLFDGQYLTNPPSYGNKSGQKIRFTVEL